MKKIFISAVIFLIIITAGGLIFYSRFRPKPLIKITYGWQTWPGVLPYLVAYDQGIFEKEGLDVKMMKESSYLNKIDKLTKGVIDFSADIVLLDVIKKVSSGNKLKIVLVNDYSNGADGIAAKKEIKSIGELKGKKVSVELDTLGEYLLYDALKKNNLDISDIRTVNLSAIDSAKAFIRGEVDAAVTYEPDYSEAIKDGNGWRIFTSADSPGLIIDVLTFNYDFASKNPDKVKAVVKSYFKALDFISTNPEKAYAIGGKYFKITSSEFKKQYAGVKQIDFNDNLNIMSYGTGTDSLHGLTKQASNYLQVKGNLKNSIDSTEIIEPKFIRELTD